MPCPRESPSEIANGRTLKDFFPREVSSLLPIPENLMSGDVKDNLQKEIRQTGGQRWSEHTKKLPPLEIGAWVQLQNLRGRHPLKSDSSGVVIGRRNENSYAIKVNGSEIVTVRNRSTLRRIPTPVQIHRPVAIGSLTGRNRKESANEVVQPCGPSENKCFKHPKGGTTYSPQGGHHRGIGRAI